MSFLKNITFYFKTFVAVNIFFGCAIYGVFASSVLSLMGKQKLAQYTVARAFYNSFSWCLNIKIKVVNEQKLLDNLPGILIGNHQSSLDILILGRIFPKGCTVTAKKSLKYIPFLGWFMSLSGTFFLDRTNRKKSIDTLNTALHKMKNEKRSLWLFPEGTRSYSKDIFLADFKKGAFHLAVDAQVPILPVVVSNTSNIINFKEKVFNQGTIIVECLDPIPTEGLTKEDISELTKKSRDSMWEAIQRIGYSSVNDSSTKKILENEDSTQVETSTYGAVDDAGSTSPDDDAEDTEQVMTDHDDDDSDKKVKKN